jgi:acyl-CoA thioester hydrolase
MEFEYELLIKENHLDSFGHVNNATYLALYEEARWDFIHKSNYGIDKILKSQKGPVLLEVNLKFKRELKNREVIKIITDNQWIKGKIMGLRQRMLNSEGKVCSEAEFVIGFMDLKERKLVVPNDEWLIACGLK